MSWRAALLFPITIWAAHSDPQASAESEQGNLCTQTLLTPINIEYAAKYSEIPLKISPQVVKNVHLLRSANEQFVIDGEFGEIDYVGYSFAVERVVLKLPGEHLVAGLGFSLEMQFEAIAMDGRRLLLCLPFELLEDFTNPALKQFKLQTNLTALAVGQAKNLAAIDVSPLLGQVERFYMYPGQLTTGRCEYSVTLVAAEGFFVGARQLGGFALDSLPGRAPAKTKPTTLYQNFVWWDLGWLYEQLLSAETLAMADAPVPPELGPYMYAPSVAALPLGVFVADEKRVLPFWKRPADADDPPPFELHGEMKLFTLYYEQLDRVWRPRLIVIPRSYDTNFEDTPEVIPAYFRADYLVEGSNTRPVHLVEMIISFTGSITA